MSGAKHHGDKVEITVHIWDKDKLLEWPQLSRNQGALPSLPPWVYVNFNGYHPKYESSIYKGFGPSLRMAAHSKEVWAVIVKDYRYSHREGRVMAFLSKPEDFPDDPRCFRDMIMYIGGEDVEDERGPSLSDSSGKPDSGLQTGRSSVS